MGFSSLWTATNSTLEKVIWAFFIGVVLAAIMLWYNQRVPGSAVRALNSKKANSPDTALTLAELGCDNIFIRTALKRSDSTLRKVVYSTNNTAKIKKEDFSEARFYIPEEQKDRAEIKYKAKNTTIPIVLLTIVLMLILALLSLKYIPKLLELIIK